MLYQINYFVKIVIFVWANLTNPRQYKKEWKKYYSNLDLKQFTDNKTFWQNMKPFLSDKNKATEKITLVSDDKFFSDDLEITEKFNEFFKNAVNDMNYLLMKICCFPLRIYLIQFR